MAWPDALLESLAPHHRVIYYDHRDTGRSIRAFDQRPYGLADLAADAIVTLDAPDIERVHVVGMSMGRTSCSSCFSIIQRACAARPGLPQPHWGRALQRQRSQRTSRGLILVCWSSGGSSPIREPARKRSRGGSSLAASQWRCAALR